MPPEATPLTLSFSDATIVCTVITGSGNINSTNHIRTGNPTKAVDARIDG